MKKDLLENISERTYKLGVITGNTRKELMGNVIEHVGLSLPDDGNIGRKVRYKNPSCEIEKLDFIIESCQKVWGFDGNGCYTMINGYRLSNEETPFGRPASLGEIYLIE